MSIAVAIAGNIKMTKSCIVVAMRRAGVESTPNFKVINPTIKLPIIVENNHKHRNNPIFLLNDICDDFILIII